LRDDPQSDLGEVCPDAVATAGVEHADGDEVAAGFQRARGESINVASTSQHVRGFRER
jgi:hypothetical protein